MRNIFILLTILTAYFVSGCIVFESFYYFNGSIIYDTTYNYSDNQLDSACLLMMYKYPKLEVSDSIINDAKRRFTSYTKPGNNLDLYKKTKKYYEFPNDEKIKNGYLCQSLTSNRFYFFYVARSEIYLLWIIEDDFCSRVKYRDGMKRDEAKHIQKLFYKEIITRIDTVLIEMHKK